MIYSKHSSFFKLNPEKRRSPIMTAKIVGIYTVVIDPSRSLKDLLSAGKWNSVDSRIPWDVSIRSGGDKREAEVVLFHSNRSVPKEDAKREMEEQGYRPTDTEELLSLGVAHPELQDKYQAIVALHSEWTDYPNDNVFMALCSLPIGTGKPVRSVELLHYNNEMGKYACFAAVRVKT